MEPVLVDVDGRIDLVDWAPSANQSSDQAELSRRSRLNDVMIVLEGDRLALQASLRARVQQRLPELGCDNLTLTLDQKAPRFDVSLRLVTSDATLDDPASMAGKHRTALETEIASEIFTAIEQRVSNIEPRRWQPSVTATFGNSNSSSASSSEKNSSIWLKTLLLLLAAVILGAAYLYMKSVPT